MQNKKELSSLEIFLMLLAAFLGGAVAGFFLDTLRKNLGCPRYVETKEQQAAREFRNDLAMEMEELR